MEWLKNQKWSNHCLRFFPLNVFITIIVIFSCLSIACTNMCLEVHIGMKKWKLLKFVFLIKMAPLGINNFNFGNSELKYTYLIYCLIKTKNKMTSKLL